MDLVDSERERFDIDPVSQEPLTSLLSVSELVIGNARILVICHAYRVQNQRMTRRNKRKVVTDFGDIIV